jgi:hypothetical protein
MPVLVSSPNVLPVGTQLTVRLMPEGKLAVESVAAPAALAGQQALARFENQWPQLAHGAAVLKHLNPAAAAALAEKLPQAAALAPGLAQYVDALQHHSVQKWLGNDVVTMLRALGVDLTQDLSQLAVLRQPGPEGWQGVIFPYLENPQGQPQQGRFFWKHGQPEDEQARPNTRFVVEMNLSALGEVQLDGMLAYPELWLKLRLHPSADVGFADGLAQVVRTMLDAFELGGGISVERGRPSPSMRRGWGPGPPGPPWPPKPEDNTYGAPPGRRIGEVNGAGGCPRSRRVRPGPSSHVSCVRPAGAARAGSRTVSARRNAR